MLWNFKYVDLEYFVVFGVWFLHNTGNSISFGSAKLRLWFSTTAFHNDIYMTSMYQATHGEWKLLVFLCYYEKLGRSLKSNDVITDELWRWIIYCTTVGSIRWHSQWRLLPLWCPTCLWYYHLSDALLMALLPRWCPTYLGTLWTSTLASWPTLA